MNKKKLVILLLPFLLAASGCYRVTDKVEPELGYRMQAKHVESLDFPFETLSSQELATNWGTELLIARVFAKELDFYRAISTYKRSLVLMPPDCPRKMEAEYGIVASYYLGQKYDLAVSYFDNSSLPLADKSFTAFHDLLVILYDCYGKLHENEKQERIAQLLENNYLTTYTKLIRAKAMQEADMIALQADGNIEVMQIAQSYLQQKKSVAKAQMLNVFLPGAGFLYVGQKKTAITAFLINAAFITATCELFHRGYIGWGLITAGFEAGWYFGGIYGAGESAKFYNERLYEQKMENYMNKNGMFPVFMLKYSF